MNIIDIVAIIILAITVLFGYKRGLVKVGFKLLTFIVSLILTLVLLTPVTNLVIENTPLDDNIQNAIIQNFGEGSEVNLTGVEFIDKYIQEIKDTSVEAVSNQIAINATKVVTAIGLFLAIRIISFVFYKFSEMIAELPVVKQFNKAGGILYGVLEGVIIIYLAIMLASVIATVTNNINILEYLNGSFIARLILKL